jgi:hypothetical protein
LSTVRLSASYPSVIVLPLECTTNRPFRPGYTPSCVSRHKSSPSGR